MVTLITKKAFYNQSIENITIAEDVTTVKNYVFRECQNLETLEIPNTVTQFGKQDF